MTSQPPPSPGDEFGSVPQFGDRYSGPPSNGMSVAALVLGLVSIPGAIIPYVGAVAGVLAIVFGVIGIRQARAGRSTRRSFAMAGLITGLAGLVLSIVLFAWALHQFRACENKIGHKPNSAELQQCIRDHV